MPVKTSRRSFLKGAAFAAGAVAVSAAGCELISPHVLKERMELDINESVWALDRPPANQALEDDITVDIAVIGGGYTGLSAAFHLKRHFPVKNIVLLEAQQVGHGASGRNGGMVLTQTSNDSMMMTSEADIHKRMYEYTELCIREMAGLMKTHGFREGIRLDGGLKTFTKAGHTKSAQDYARQAESLGIPIQYWNQDQVKEALGTDVYFGALYDPNCGDVNPMKLVYSLKKAAEGEGVVIFGDTPIKGIEEGKTIGLLTEQGKKVTAQSIVLATNGYTSKLGYFKHGVIPLHTQCAVTPRLEADVFSSIGYNRRLSFFDSNNLLYHLGTTEDNRILMGGGDPYYFFNNGLKYKRDLNEIGYVFHKELTRIWPGLIDVKFEYIWNGVIGLSLDFNQSVGVTGEYKNIYYGLSYCGHGVTLSYLFGKIIADLIKGEFSKWEGTPFLNYELPYIPAEPGRWLGLQCYKTYLKMLDSA